MTLLVLGGILDFFGLVLMFATIRLFGTVGKGTLAPWNPTQRLVVQGIYRHVRNPMMSGVFFILLGDSFVAPSFPLFCWFLIFVAVNGIYLPSFEEPGLVKRVGDEYLAYKRTVPRWILRVRGWDGHPTEM
jgi:protein-S-isoprenylcysteine O-methyltransferase Ste14